MKSLTNEQKDKYIKNNGKKCPFCESDFIEGIDVEFPGDDILYAIVECNDCGEWWRDRCEIKLVDVIHNEEDEWNKEHYGEPF